MFGFYDERDREFEAALEKRTLLDGVDPEKLPKYPGARTFSVSFPTKEFSFLHEAAIAAFGGTLYASWYNNPERELRGYTPVRLSRSLDGGKTWTEPETVAGDPEEKLLFCPPVFGTVNGKLYLFINEMVGPDIMHGMRIYLLEGEKFVFVKRTDVPHKLNANVVTLPDGRLTVPCRYAEPDALPYIPALLFCDGGDPLGEWRVAKTRETRLLPGQVRYECPEPAVIIVKNRITMFVRDDHRRVPLLCVSDDLGESWSEPVAHDIPFSDSKIYAGTLSDGRNYVIGNLYPGRKKLAIFFSGKEKMKFTEGFILQDGYSEELGFGEKWHYPAAIEKDGKLYVICTVNPGENDLVGGAALTVLDL
ncbi:MAG: exo-alpha-sialidase [Clostridia bacterium]|nr:exo-alpha-sialidase [Clostridia bacterium]